MLMKVSDLDGRALNWAVGFSISDMRRDIGNDQTEFMINDKIWVVSAQGNEADDTEFNPCGNWAHGGPIFEKTGIFPTYCHDWDAFHGPQTDPMPYEAEGERCVMYGEKPLIAGCRAVVYNAVGPTIEIPDELCEVKSCK